MSLMKKSNEPKKRYGRPGAPVKPLEIKRATMHPFVLQQNMVAEQKKISKELNFIAFCIGGILGELAALAVCLLMGW